MTKIEQHEKICKELHDLYVQKNTAYGDSFGETYKKLGIISAVTRISDKYNRLVNLATHRDVNQGDESLRDTLIDLGNYALMTAMELDNENTTVKITDGIIVEADDGKRFTWPDNKKIVPSGESTVGANPSLSTVTTDSDGMKYTE